MLLPHKKLKTEIFFLNLVIIIKFGHSDKENYFKRTKDNFYLIKLFYFFSEKFD